MTRGTEPYLPSLEAGDGTERMGCPAYCSLSTGRPKIRHAASDGVPGSQFRLVHVAPHSIKVGVGDDPVVDHLLQYPDGELLTIVAHQAVGEAGVDQATDAIEVHRVNGLRHRGPLVDDVVGAGVRVVGGADLVAGAGSARAVDAAPAGVGLSAAPDAGRASWLAVGRVIASWFASTHAVIQITDPLIAHEQEAPVVTVVASIGVVFRLEGYELELPWTRGGRCGKSAYVS